MRTLATALLVLLLLPAAARAGAAFGGDDAGFVPNTDLERRCQGKLIANLGNLAVCATKCHTRMATAAFQVEPFAEAVCEATCVVRYREKAARILLTNACPGECLEQTRYGSLMGAFLDQANGDYFCDGVVPLGDGDDAGVVPSTDGVLRCETRIAKKGASLIRCVLGCHQRLADRAFGGLPFDEEACETACQVGFVNVGLVGTCPSCIAYLPGVAGEVRAFLDSTNGLIYCTSPGAAFLDP
ncbi:MAG: hypothetical protein U0807_11325 [Candidatus Binatia bacterium]